MVRIVARGALGVLLLLATGSALARWCDAPFKDVAVTAHSVVLVSYDASQPTRLPVVEVLRGESFEGPLVLAPYEVGSFEPRSGDRFLIALSDSGRPIKTMTGMGACGAVWILPIQRGKLKARYRPDYDGRSRSISLEALRIDLRATPDGLLAGAE